MSLPYFPMYPSDFEAKTSHLTIAEDGAYNRLLRICWMTPGCSMPADDVWIMRRARAVSDADQVAVLAVLEEFFDVVNGRYSNARLSREWLAANEAHEKRKNAGAKGGKAKSLKSNNSTSSNAVAKPKQPEPEPEKKVEIGKPISCAFSDFWNHWPNKTAKAAAEKAWAKLSQADRLAARNAASDGWFEKWRQSQPNANPIHPASYLNSKRWNDEFHPKFSAIKGGQNDRPANKSASRMDAFIAGARGTYGAS